MQDVNISENIVFISYNPNFQKQEIIDTLFESLKGKSKRSWFVNHAYHCLPLVIGNQYGFILKSLEDYQVTWNGGDSPSDVTVIQKTHNNTMPEIQKVNSHFGMGTITVQTPFTMRTPENINIMTINPPNMPIDGIYHMTGVVEADNLRRDFTFNLRITRKNHPVQIKTGDPIGCFIPYPRHFIDQYQIVNATNTLTAEQLEIERETIRLFGQERSVEDKHKKHGNGKRYWRGVDIYGNKFKDHQTTLDQYEKK